MSEEKRLQQFIRKVSEMQEGERELDQNGLDAIARELGLSDEELGAAERQAEKLLTQGRAFRKTDLLDRAVEALEDAHALSPFRSDVTRELAVTLLERFKQRGAQDDRDAAEALLEAAIDQDEADTTNYDLLRQVQALRRPGPAWRVWLIAVMAVVLGVVGTLGAQRMLPEAAPPPAAEAVAEVDARSAVPVAGPPTIVRIDPSVAPPGAPVEVTGTNFVVGQTLVKVGGVDNITPLPEHDTTAFRFTVPTEAEGSTAVEVRTPGGVTTSFASFRVGLPTSPPIVTQISPAAGPPGQWLYVSGSNFVTGHTTVSYGGVTDIQPLVYSSEQLAFTVPKDATESSRVTVTTPAGDWRSAAVFRLIPGS